MYDGKSIRVLVIIVLLITSGLIFVLNMLNTNTVPLATLEVSQVPEILYTTEPTTTPDEQEPPEATTTTQLVSEDKEEPQSQVIENETTEPINTPSSQRDAQVVENAPLPAVVPDNVTVRRQSLFDIEEMLDLHNEVRSDKGIPPLTWSDTLAQGSLEWGDFLVSDGCTFYHDPDNNTYGENLFWAWTSDSKNRGLISSPEDAVEWWADEERFYTYRNNTCQRGEECGHYTQIVWADTTQVGCSVSTCFDKRNDDTQTDLWVCRYNPPGNDGGRPY